MKKLCLSFLICMILSSCQKDDMVRIGEDFLRDYSYDVLIDTVSIRTSTIMRDSTKSSGGEVVMVGNMYDGEFGQINVRSCFQIGPPDMTGYDGLHNSATFDSIILELILLHTIGSQKKGLGLLSNPARGPLELRKVRSIYSRHGPMPGKKLCKRVRISLVNHGSPYTLRQAIPPKCWG